VLVDVTAAQHDALLVRGWRRFGCEWFRPVCPACTACRSLRIPLVTFTLSRSQRRALRGNTTVEVIVQAPTITRAHLHLYNAYHAAMHRQKGWP
jgi:arginine-tRNA-protein transferase